MQDLLINLARKIDNMEKTMKEFLNTMEDRPSTGVKSEHADDADLVKGVNVMRLPSRDTYSFALQLMDIFFTREELATSLMFKSKKSDKPALNQAKVERILGYVEKKYGDSWDIKTLRSKANQKCRDSKLVTAHASENVKL